MAVTNKALLKADAKNRALRSFLQGLGIDVAVALATVLVTAFADAGNWGAVQWAILSFTLFKTCVQSLASYVMRYWLDRKANVLIPPDPQAEPAEPVPAADMPEVHG